MPAPAALLGRGAVRFRHGEGVPHAPERPSEPNDKIRYIMTFGRALGLFPLEPTHERRSSRFSSACRYRARSIALGEVIPALDQDSDATDRAADTSARGGVLLLIAF